MEISSPWDGVVLGDATAAPYSSLEWAAIWRDLMHGSKANEGPILGSGTSPDPGLTVQATGPASAAVQVTPGSAIVRGTWYNSNALLSLAIAANASGNPRIDTVILRKNYAAQTIRLAILQGATAVSPVPAALTQTDGVTWEIPLAYVTVASGFATIVAANIQEGRVWAGLADGVYLEDIKNNSGGTLNTGDVVIWDSGTDRAVTVTAAEGFEPAGVWVGQTPGGGYGRVLQHGIGYVRTNAAVTGRGVTLCTSTTSKQAMPMPAAASSSKLNGIGESLEVTGGAGLCLCIVNIGKRRVGAVVSLTTGGAGNSNSTIFVDSNAANKITITPHGDRVRVTAMVNGYINGAALAYWDIYSVELTARAGDATTGLGSLENTGAIFHPVTIVGIFTGLTPGQAAEFRLQHRTSDAGVNVNTLSNLVMYAEEF